MSLRAKRVMTALTVSGPRQMAVVLLVLAGFVLGSCASSEQVRERQAAAQASEMEADDAKCKEQGAEPDTPAYVQCRDRISQKRAEQEAQQAKRNEAFQRTLGEGTSALSGH